MTAAHSGTVLIYSIHRSEPWWRCVGESMGFEKAVLVTDLRGEGDINVVDDFYAGYSQYQASGATQSTLISAAEIDDVIARCRMIRWMPRKRAVAMVLAMTEAMDAVLDAVQPRVVVSWPMDRYNIDVLERRANARGIPYYELTASTLADLSMLLYRGQLVKHPTPPEPAEVARRTAEIADPQFKPAYVAFRKRYTQWRWLRTFAYFRLRGWVFRAIAIAKRDPLNLHYLDAQAFLGHKPKLADIRVTRLIDHDWRATMEAFPKDKRLFIALQLFPEASIDYWIEDIGLLDQDDVLTTVARSFSDAGYTILIKDHPIQFGFRQCGLFERLRAIPGVVIVPYEVSGNELLAASGVSFTSTGTLGLQAALLGLKSITYRTYYATPDDFILFDRRSDLAGLPARVAAFPEVGDLKARQHRIVKHMLEGSFEGDFITIRQFGPEKAAAAQALGREFGKVLNALA